MDGRQLISICLNIWFIATVQPIFVESKNILDKDKFIQELIEQVKQLTSRVTSSEERILNLETQNAKLKTENFKLKTENFKLKTENFKLKTEIVELKACLNKNSSNSSKPPSSDGYQKKPALPKTKNGKQGGQKGHKGRTLKQVSHPDQVIKCLPGQCPCGHKFLPGELAQAERRQVFELPKPRLEITEYQIHKATCPVCGTNCKGNTPEGVNAPVQYGNGVKSYIVLLGTHFNVPFKKIQLLFNDLFGYPINESTAFSAGKQCHERLSESEDIIKARIADSQTAHADETGIRVAGKLSWLHTATTQSYTYLFMHEKRGRLALESEKSLLNKFSGWLVHDCWSSYFKFQKFKHALCGAHILRELEDLKENYQSKWANVFRQFLLNTYQMPFEERVKRRQQINDRYDQICAIGLKSEPLPIKTNGKRGRYKRTKGRNLVERLIREKTAVLAFAFNIEVPFTNNLAERDIRPSKVKQKVSNCFRTIKGAEIYARIQGFISTARKNNRNVFSELFNTFDGHNFITEM